MRVRVGAYWLAVGAMLLFVLLAMQPSRVSAAAGINQELSFEGKIVTAAGLNIPDGTYNMEFKIYTAAGSCNPSTGVGCTLGWTEDWLISNSQGVTFTSGTYQVNLDSVAANNFSGIDFNTNPLYLSLQIGSTSSCTPAGNFTANCGGDGEMKPYILLTASPYALNAGLLGDLSSSAFGQLAANQTWTGTNTFQPTTNINGLTVKQTSVGSPSADIFDVQSANGSSIVQVTGPSANNAAVSITSLGSNALTLTSGAALTFTGAANSTWDLGSGHTLSLQTTNNGPITTGSGLLTVGGSTSLGNNVSFSGTSARTITGPGTGGLTVTVASGPLALSTTASGTLSVTSAGALNFTGAAASTWDVGSNLLSLQTTNNGAITTGTGLLTQGGNVTFSGTSARTITGPGTGGLTLTVASGPLSLTTTSSGALTITAAAASVWSTSSGTLTVQSASGSAFTASAQGAGQTNLGTVGTGLTLVGNTTGSTELQGPTYTNATAGVLVGTGATTSAPILFQLDNATQQGAETSANCTTAINSGSIYYSAATASSNTTTNEVRGCINGVWTDVVTGDQLGILLFGVEESSGTTIGDITGVTGYTNAPCKVTWATATSVTVAPCTAYSGGRKVVITAAVTISGLGTGGSVTFQHICLTGTNGAPQATAANVSETAAVPAWSAAAPILCLATVKLNTTPALTNIYDTRVFTTSVKQYTTSSSAVAPGMAVVQDTTADNLVKTSSATGTADPRGVVAVGNSAGSTTTVNAIIVTSGPVFIKATGTVTLGRIVETTTTAGYVAGVAIASSGSFKDFGLIVGNGNTAACNASSNCQFSIFTDLIPGY